jgi:hypothetical protein
VLTKSGDIVSIAVCEEHDRGGAVIDKNAVQPHAELVAELESLMGQVLQPAVVLVGWLESEFSFEQQ